MGQGAALSAASPRGVSRRAALWTASQAAWLGLAGCDTPRDIAGGFVGVSHVRGHLLREGTLPSTPSLQRKTRVLIAGGGVAGLSAARALRMQGVDDFALLELEDSAGGNARAGSIAGMAHPLGAHYLPLPSDHAPEVQDFLQELGLRQRVAGRWQYDEKHLCHSPQERLYFNGVWQEGLQPLHGVSAQTLAQYTQFATLMEAWQKTGAFQIPMLNTPKFQQIRAQAAMTFIAYLDAQGLTDAHLRWYLDYCCRDDYGAGIDVVSAWAGIHYFAARHGFHAPGAAQSDKEGVLTWPQGNAFLTQALARSLGDRLYTGRVVLRIEEVKNGVQVDAYNAATQGLERWQAERCIVALPVFVAAKVVVNAPDFVRQAAQHTAYSSWLVANVHIDAPLRDAVGAPPSWDNVIYGAHGLGYVDAMHQSTRPVHGASVLTYYSAWGHAPEARRNLLASPWAQLQRDVMAELAVPHPDLAQRARQIDITRYGHAMAVPTPQFIQKIAFKPNEYERKQLLKSEQTNLPYAPRPVPRTPRLAFAHSDWAGYSVFEEAFVRGLHAV